MNASEFDLALIEEGDRPYVEAATKRIHDLTRRSAKDIVEIGRALTEVKGRVGHGRFGEWIESEFGWTHQTAMRFMQVSDRFGQNQQIVENAAPSALYALASGSVPESIRDEFIEKAESGERIRHKDVQERLSEIRQPATPAMSVVVSDPVEVVTGEIVEDEIDETYVVQCEPISEVPPPPMSQSHSTRLINFPIQSQLAPAVGDEPASLRLVASTPLEAQSAVMAAFPMIGFIHPPDAMKIVQKLNEMDPFQNQAVVTRIQRNDRSTLAELVDRTLLQVDSPEDLAATQAGEAWRKTLASISQRLASVYREGGVPVYAPHWSKMERHELLHQTNGMIGQLTRFRDDLKGFINEADA